jgi:hypothetical protein
MYWTVVYRNMLCVGGMKSCTWEWNFMPQIIICQHVVVLFWCSKLHTRLCEWKIDLWWRHMLSASLCPADHLDAELWAQVLQRVRGQALHHRHQGQVHRGSQVSLGCLVMSTLLCLGYRFWISTFWPSAIWTVTFLWSVIWMSTK